MTKEEATAKVTSSLKEFLAGDPRTERYLERINVLSTLSHGSSTAEASEMERQDFEEKPTFLLEPGQNWVVEKVNFSEESPLKSVTLIRNNKGWDGKRFALIKEQNGDKYFLDISDPLAFATIRNAAFINPHKKDSFIDRSVDLEKVGLMADEVSNYWIGLSGYKPEIEKTYTEIHQRMLDTLKDKLATLPPETKVRLIEIGCGKGELMQKAVSDPFIRERLSRVELLDLYEENVSSALEGVSTKLEGTSVSCRGVAEGMPDGIDKLSGRMTDECTLVLSSGSLTHQVLTRDQAVRTVDKLYEKADEVLIGGYTNSWINKKSANTLGFSVEQAARIEDSEILMYPTREDGEMDESREPQSVKFKVVHNDAPSIVSVLTRSEALRAKHEERREVMSQVNDLNKSIKDNFKIMKEALSSHRKEDAEHYNSDSLHGPA